MSDETRLRSAATGLLGGVFLLSGGTKLAGTEEQVEEFERYGYPQWFRTVTGALEASGGAGLVLGVASPLAGLVGAGVTTGVMAGAVATHLLRVRDPVEEAVPAAVLGLVSFALVATGLRSRTGAEE
jgi:uncharacterized membrane protein YphA (DoxX/SURF4 family)